MMEILFVVAVFVFAGVSTFFILSANKIEEQNSTYETVFCRDVRANLGMIVSSSEVEAKREKLNNKKSKF